MKLKPCPFCGNSEIKYCTSFTEVTLIVCHECGAITSFKGNETIKDAVNAYNRRKEND